jgi:hypothetical protein
MTPGSAAAAAISMRVMRAEAYGLRTILPCSMPGTEKSPAKIGRPRTFSHASARGRLLPMTR